MSKLAKALTAAAGNAGESLYVEDVFSTYLYSGTSATHNITNNVNLADEGGLVWIKGRSGVFSATNHRLFDTERGVYKHLATNLTSSEGTHTNTLTAFNTDGFTLGTDASLGEVNYTGMNYASWTFRKAEKFFDVVTFSGNGASSQSISHNLGSVPAMIITKSLNNGYRWNVWHIGLGVNTNPTYANMLFLQTTDQTQLTSSGGIANPTDTSFDVGGVFANKSGDSYVAYLFASDAGGFGDDGSESIIKCGSFTLDGSGNASIDCGFEPQWVLAKRTDGAQDWYLTDMMRGMAQTTNGSGTLSPNLSDAEYMYNRPKATATGFDYVFIPNTSYIYIAIRRPMKTPESGTEVFTSNDYVGNGLNGTVLTSVNDPVDLAIIKRTNTTGEWVWSDRLRGAKQTLFSNSTALESTENTGITGFDVQAGIEVGSNTLVNATGSDYISYMLSRATGFFDVVAYTGDRVSEGGPQTITHNLKVIPELAIVKERSGADPWYVASTELNNYEFLTLNTTNGLSSDSVTPYIYDLAVNNFKVGARNQVNATGSTYIAYLFATVAGVSKVGSYTGTGATQTIDCGFSNGARFVLIKSTTYSSGSWFVFDTARGITTTAPTSPFLTLNSTGAESASSIIEPDPTGFKIIATGAGTNGVGNSYIFLAIA